MMTKNRADELSNRLTTLLDEYPEVDKFFFGVKTNDQLIIITDACPICFKDAIVNWTVDNHISHVAVSESRVAQC